MRVSKNFYRLMRQRNYADACLSELEGIQNFCSQYGMKYRLESNGNFHLYETSGENHTLHVQNIAVIDGPGGYIKIHIQGYHEGLEKEMYQLLSGLRRNNRLYFSTVQRNVIEEKLIEFD